MLNLHFRVSSGFTTGLCDCIHFTTSCWVFSVVISSWCNITIILLLIYVSILSGFRDFEIVLQYYWFFSDLVFRGSYKYQAEWKVRVYEKTMMSKELMPVNLGAGPHNKPDGPCSRILGMGLYRTETGMNHFNSYHLAIPCNLYVIVPVLIVSDTVDSKGDDGGDWLWPRWDGHTRRVDSRRNDHHTTPGTAGNGNGEKTMCYYSFNYWIT